MPLTIASINSGSNGNCYYIGNQREAVLIDAGISCRITEMRMAKLGLSIGKVRAVFISHEHTDHTRGVEVLSRRHQIPVYITETTYRSSRLMLDERLVRPLTAYTPVGIGDLQVNAFPKQHDASDCHSFIVSGDGVTVGVMTDIGSVCENVIRNFRLCHAAFLEANYDEDMLREGRYPPYLKTRIRSDHGHLSNHQALELFLKHRPPFMTHLLLSHLSQDNNDPQLVMATFAPHSNGVGIMIASRYEESPVYTVDGGDKLNKPGSQYDATVFPTQMKLF